MSRSEFIQMLRKELSKLPQEEIDARSEGNGITINFSSRGYEPFVEITCRDTRTLDTIKIETENGDVDIFGIEVGSIVVYSEYGEVCFDEVGFDRGELDVENGDMYQDDYECRYNGGLGSNILKLFSEYGDVKVNFGVGNQNSEVHENHNNHE